MVWYNLQVGKYQIKYTPLKAETKEYPYCDKDGNPVKKVMPVNKEKSYFIDDKGTKTFNAFRLINGNPRAKLSKTKEVSVFKEVDKNEVEDLLIEKQYLVDCSYLLEDLKTTGKCLKFGFTNGNGYKVFKAYIHRSNLYKDLLFMSLGITQKSEIIQNLKEVMKNKTEDLQITIDGVDKAKVEDLIEI